MKKYLYATMLVVVALSLTGLKISGNNVIWYVLHGTERGAGTTYYMTGTGDFGFFGIADTQVGNPRGLGNPPNVNPLISGHDDIYKRQLTSRLPDGFPISTTYPDIYTTFFSTNGPDVYTVDGITTTDINATGVYVHYVNSRKADADGNEIHHSLGYFTWTGSAPPDKSLIQETIIFPNLSSLSAWECMRLVGPGANGGFPAGSHITFVLVADKWNGVPTGTAKSPIKVSPNVTTADITNATFYTYNPFNPDGQQHAVMFWDKNPGTTPNKVSQLVIGMDDGFGGGGDQDFNDVLFTVDADPNNLTFGPPELPPLDYNDRDGDGVKEPYDVFPDDPTRAFEISGTWGTLSFEDLWPITGDYDLNDLTARLKVGRVTDATGLVKDLEFTVQIQARGAGISSGFGIELTGLNPNNVVVSDVNKTEAAHTNGLPNGDLSWWDYAARLTVPGASAAPVLPEVGNGTAGVDYWLTWIFFNNGKTYAPDLTPYKYFNTAKNQTPQPPTQTVPEFTLTMTFRNAVNPATLGAIPFNPFIFRTAKRGQEVHLLNDPSIGMIHPPTSLADPSLFGKEADTKDPETGITYYRTATGLPWAFYIPEKWTTHPLEDIAVSKAYGDFANWVELGGSLAVDWYLTPIPAKYFNYGHGD